jgi:hypothetical protein
MPKVYVFLVLLGTIGCNPSQKKGIEDSPILAEVGKQILTLSQAESLLGSRLKNEDSAQVLESYVKSWIKNQALHEYALEHLSEQQLNQDSLLENYYKDLIFFELQKAYLDTLDFDSISDGEIEKYYTTYPNNFLLTENIVRLNFYKIPLHVKKIDRLWKSFNDARPKDITLLKQVTDMAGGYYFLNDTLWLSFSDVQKEIPIVTYNQENFLNYTKKIRLRDEKYVYFVHIKEFKIKNTKSPIEFEREKIRRALINKRKLTLLQQMEQEIVREMYNGQRIVKH